MPGSEHVSLQVKQALWAGGIQRSNKPAAKRNTPGLQNWEDLVRLFLAAVHVRIADCIKHQLCKCSGAW